MIQPYHTAFHELFVLFSRLKSLETSQFLKNTNVCMCSFYKLFTALASVPCGIYNHLPLASDCKFDTVVPLML